MERKKLEEFLDLSEKEQEFVNSVKTHIDAILERNFEIWGVRVGIDIFDVLIYNYGNKFIYRMYSDNVIKIYRTDEHDMPLTDLEIAIKNNEIYNNIVDKLNEKSKTYLFIKLLELAKIED